MKRYLLFCLLAISGFNLIAQISIVRTDFVDVNDSIPRIYYSFEEEGSSFPTDSIMPEDMVFDDPVFPVIIHDTLVYFPSSETDTEGLFPEATCAFSTRDGFIMHLKITDASVELIGMQGQLPFTGDIMNLEFIDNLTMEEFPCNYNNQILDQGAAYDKQPISMFESIIPADTYSQLTMWFDTVRFLMNAKINTSFDEYADIQFVGDSNQNGTFQYLRENRKMITSLDVQLRSKFGGAYTSLSDIPGVGDQLPMELPIVDTTNTHAYWAKGWKSPLLEIEYNTSYDSVYSMTFRYAYLSYVNTAISSKIKIYPNPSEDFVNFYLEDIQECSLFVFSADGRLMTTAKLNSNNTGIDISSYASGTYIYQILDKNKVPVAGGKLLKN